MKKMKRVLVALLSCLTAFACLAGTVACGDDKKTNDVPNNNSQSESPADSSSKDDNSSNDEVTEPEKDYCAENGHFLVVLEEIPATCTTNGRAATVGCANCDWYHNPAPVLKDRAEYATEGEYTEAYTAWATYWAEYSALGKHVWSEKAVEQVNETCCQTGFVEHYTCTICNVKGVATGEKDSDDKAIIVEKEDKELVIPASGKHEYLSYVVPVAAECEKAGTTAGWVCKNGGSQVATPIPALGHDKKNAEGKYAEADSRDATCTAKAYCGVCDKEYGEVLSHELVSEAAKQVTCLEDGWAAYTYCKKCSYTTFQGKILASTHWTEQQTAKNYTEVPGVEPTCTTAGNFAYVACNMCSVKHQYVAGAGVTEDFYKTNIVRPALYHNITAPTTPAVAATCTTAGNKAGGVCTRCNANVAAESIPALGHAKKNAEGVYDVAGSSDATCTANAVCGRCGELKDTKKGHTWTSVNVKYATCEATGVAAHSVCSVCKVWAKAETETANPADGILDNFVVTPESAFTIPALGHDIKNAEAKASTCSVKGWEAYTYCAHCNYTTFAESPLKAHQSINMNTCSAQLVCETVYATSDVNNDGKIDINDVTDKNSDGKIDEKDYHVGCGAVYPNPKTAQQIEEAHIYVNNVCKVCKTCKHADNDPIDGVCDNCNVCFHTKHNKDGKCEKCYATVEHTYAAIVGGYACSVCGLKCDHDTHNKELNCVTCGNAISEGHTYVNGVCSECGLTCEHKDAAGNATFDADKKCTTCKQPCGHFWANGTGVCTTCGYECTETKHTVAGACIICGEASTHVWTPVLNSTNYECKGCGDICRHEFHMSDAKCVKCNATVEHKYDLTKVYEAVNGDKYVKCSNSLCSAESDYKLHCKHEKGHAADQVCFDCKGIAPHKLAATAVAGVYQCSVESCKASFKDVITQSATINANITVSNANAEGDYVAIWVKNEKTGDPIVVTITGGSYNAGSGKVNYHMAVYAEGNVKVVIEGGEFYAGKDVNGQGCDTVYASKGATVEIKGGTFRGEKNTQDYAEEQVTLLNCKGETATVAKSTITVTGGIFYGFNPENNVADGANTNYVANGYEAKPIDTNQDGTPEYYVVQKKAA